MLSKRTIVFLPDFYLLADGPGHPMGVWFMTTLRGQFELHTKYRTGTTSSALTIGQPFTPLIH
jgi:hypothetical protein